MFSDGDAVGIILMLDDKLTSAVAPLQLHKNIFDPNKPRTISDVPSLPKPVVANIIQWIYTPTPVTNLDLMKRFAI